MCMRFGKADFNTHRARAVQSMAFPLSFVFSSSLNLIFFYLGLAYEDNAVRKYGYILGCVLFAVFCGLTLLDALRKHRLSFRAWMFLSLTIVFFGLCYGISFWKFGRKSILVGYVRQFVVFMLPAFFAGICAAMRNGERSFFSVLESASFFVFPGAVIYANSTAFNCLPWNDGADLGILNYMSLAYTFMPFLLAHIVCFVERKEWTIPFAGRTVRRVQLLRGVFIAVYWFAIIASATRGTYLCVAGFCVLLVLSKLLHREKTVKPAFFVSAAMAALLLFNLFIYTPPGLYRLGRVNVFLEGLQEHRLTTTDREDPAVANRIEELVQAQGGQQIANRPENGSENDPSTQNVPAGDALTEGIAAENLQIHDRGTLYRLAIEEFKKAPLFGMGPGGFSVKYGEYPHNAVLELLCETGILGTGVMLFLLFYAMIRMLRIGWRNEQTRYLLLFFIAYAIRANISGSIWECSAVLGALGYALAVPLDGKRAVKQEGNSIIETE